MKERSFRVTFIEDQEPEPTFEPFMVHFEEPVAEPEGEWTPVTITFVDQDGNEVSR